jgi:hypothetical protein
VAISKTNFAKKNKCVCHAERSEVALYAITYSVTSSFLDFFAALLLRMTVPRIFEMLFSN